MLITCPASPRGLTEVGLFAPFLGVRLLLVELIAGRRKKVYSGDSPGAALG